jgi:hypothetical protein
MFKLAESLRAIAPTTDTEEEGIALDSKLTINDSKREVACQRTLPEMGDSSPNTVAP